MDSTANGRTSIATKSALKGSRQNSITKVMEYLLMSLNDRSTVAVNMGKTISMDGKALILGEMSHFALLKKEVFSVKSINCLSCRYLHLAIGLKCRQFPRC